MNRAKVHCSMRNLKTMKSTLKFLRKRIPLLSDSKYRKFIQSSKQSISIKHLTKGNTTLWGDSLEDWKSTCKERNFETNFQRIIYLVPCEYLTTIKCFCWAINFECKTALSKVICSSFSSHFENFIITMHQYLKHFPILTWDFSKVENWKINLRLR